MLFWIRFKEILCYIIMSDIRKLRTVYIISSMAFDKSYIGSTCQRLCDRLAKHNYRKNCSSWEVIQHGDYMIAPLLIVPNCTRYEIELKEKEFLKQYNDILVNKQTVLRTPEEHQEQRIKDRLKSKEKWDDYGRIKFDCDCGGKYDNKHKSRHFKSEKHLQYLNKI